MASRAEMRARALGKKPRGAPKWLWERWCSLEKKEIARQAEDAAWEAGAAARERQVEEARQYLEHLQDVDRWYEQRYKPWLETYGGDFTEFQQWKDGRTRTLH